MASNVMFLNDGKAKIADLLNTQIIWRNFAGIVKPGHKYDREGEPYFNISLSPAEYDTMINAGWDAREWTKKDADPQETPRYYIKVTIDVDGFSKSKIWHVSDPDADGRRHKNLITYDDGTMGDLDNTVFDTVDLTLRPWTNANGLKKAYLETMYYVIAKDEWGDKWGDVMDGDFSDESVPFN